MFHPSTDKGTDSEVFYFYFIFQVKDDVVGAPAVIAYDKNSLSSSRVKFQEIEPPLSSHSSSTASQLHVSQKPVEALNTFQIQVSSCVWFIL